MKWITREHPKFDRIACPSLITRFIDAFIAKYGIKDQPLDQLALIVRSLLSQMDVPARSAFVKSVVTPGERAAAASFTAVPRSLASAAGPSIGGVLFAAGFLAAPLVSCGVLKIAYDAAIWWRFRKIAKQD